MCIAINLRATVMNAYDEKKQFVVPKQEWSTIFRPLLRCHNLSCIIRSEAKFTLKKAVLFALFMIRIFGF